MKNIRDCRAMSSLFRQFAVFLRVAAPKVVSVAELGDWQCSQSLLLVTTCIQIRQPVTATALR